MESEDPNHTWPDDLSPKIATALDVLRREYERVEPESAHWLIGFSFEIMSDAEFVANSLDRALVAQNKLAGVFDALNFGVPAALRFIALSALMSLDDLLRGKSKIATALRAGEFKAVQSKMVLDAIRRSLRDGFDNEEALEVNKDGIGGCQSSPRFLQDLAELLRAHQRRGSGISVRKAIVRAWLPLRLWDCGPDGLEAHKRCFDADQLLGLGLMPEYPAFQMAWRKVRSEFREAVKH